MNPQEKNSHHRNLPSPMLWQTHYILREQAPLPDPLLTFIDEIDPFQLVTCPMVNKYFRKAFFPLWGVEHVQFKSLFVLKSYWHSLETLNQILDIDASCVTIKHSNELLSQYNTWIAKGKIKLIKNNLYSTLRKLKSSLQLPATYV